MPKYIVTAADGKEYNVNAPEGTPQEDIVRYVQKQLGYEPAPAPAETPEEEDVFAKYKPQRGAFDAFGSGVSRGFTRLGSTFGDVLPALGASALGFDDYAKRQMEEAAATEEQLRRTNRAQFESLSDVKGPGDWLPFVAETIGEQVPNLLTSLIPGGVGATVGRRAVVGAAEKQLAGLAEKRLAGAAERKLGKEAQEQLLNQGPATEDMLQAARSAATTPEAIKGVVTPEAIEASAESMKRLLPKTLGDKAADTGAMAGLYLGSVAQNAPEIFQNIYDQTGGDLAPGAALIGGAIGGALDSILPAKLLKVVRNNPALKAEIAARIAENKGVKSGLLPALKSGAMGAAKGVGTEGLTEAAQEAISIEAERIVGETQEAWGSEEFDRLLESGVRGAVAGGVFGAGEGLGAHARERGEITRQEEAVAAEEARVKAEEEEAKRIADEAAELAGIPQKLLDLDAELQTARANATANPKDAKLQIEVGRVQKKIDELKARELLLKTPKSTTTPGTTGGATPPTTTKKNPQDYTIGDALFDVGVWSNKQDDVNKAFGKFIKEYNAGVPDDQKFAYLDFNKPLKGLDVEKLDELLDIAARNHSKIPGLQTDEQLLQFAEKINELRQNHPNFQPEAIVAGIDKSQYSDYLTRLLKGRKVGVDEATDEAILDEMTSKIDFITNHPSGNLNPELAAHLQSKIDSSSLGYVKDVKTSKTTGVFTPGYLRSLGVSDTKTNKPFYDLLVSQDFRNNTPSVISSLVLFSQTATPARLKLITDIIAKVPELQAEYASGGYPPLGGTKPPPPTGPTAPTVTTTAFPPPAITTPFTADYLANKGFDTDTGVHQLLVDADISDPQIARKTLQSLNTLFPNSTPDEQRRINEIVAETRQLAEAQEEQEVESDFTDVAKVDAAKQRHEALVNSPDPQVSDPVKQIVNLARQGAQAKGAPLTSYEIAEKLKSANQMTESVPEILANYAQEISDARISNGLVKPLEVTEDRSITETSSSVSKRYAYSNPNSVEYKKYQESVALEQDLKGKPPLEVIRHVAAITPNKSYRVIATRLAQMIEKLEKAGQKFEFAIVNDANKNEKVTYKYANGATVNDTLGGILKTRSLGCVWSPGNQKKTFILIGGIDRATGYDEIGITPETILHEYIHAAAVLLTNNRFNVSKVASPKARLAADGLVELYRYVDKEVQKAGGPHKMTRDQIRQKFGFYAEYGMKNEHEFIATALSNAQTQKFLDSISYPATNQTVFDKFIDLIRDLLGIPARANTALSQLLRVSSDFFSIPEAEIEQLVKSISPGATPSPPMSLEAAPSESVTPPPAPPAVPAPKEYIPRERPVAESVKRTFDPAERLDKSTDLAKNADKIKDAVFTYLDDMIDKMPIWAGRDIAKWFLDKVVNLSEVMRDLAFSLLSLKQLADVATLVSPDLGKSILSLRDRIAERNAEIDRQRERIEKFIDAAKKLFNKHPLKVKKEFDRIVHDSTRDQLNFQATPTELQKMQADEPEKYQQWVDLKRDFDALPADVQKLYYDLRDIYAEYGAKFRGLIQEVSDKVGALGTGNKILIQMLERQLNPYFPLWRKGDYWMQFIDSKGQENILAFETPGERRRYRAQILSQGIKAKDIIDFERITDLDVDKLPPTSQFKEVIKLLKEKNVDSSVIDAVFQSYLNFFPSNSVMQQFRPREGKLGYREDALSALADVGTRMAMNVVQFDHVTKIDDALSEAKGLIGTEGKTTSWIMKAIEGSLIKREGYMKSPMQKGTWGKIASFVGYNSYRFFLLGNISSAVVNLTQLPIVTYSLLAGEYGAGESLRAMSEASKMFFRGGSDNNSTMENIFTGKPLTDFTFFGTRKDGSRPDIPKHMQELWQRAVNAGAIRRSTGQDLQYQREYSVKTEKEETGADKILNTWNKVENNLSWIFQNSERFNREVTLLAAYKLEYNKLKKQGKLSDQEIAERAAAKAIETVEEANGSSMSETGPALFQSDIGKIVGTFKRFALAQIFLASKLFAKAFGPGSGATKEERSIARKQFGYINGMAFTFAGIKGMPFFGGLNLIASAILGDDDEPFDLEGDILRSEASWALRGPMSELTGADISSRTGFTDLVWRDDPKRLAEVGMPTYVAELALGPAMGIVNNFRRGMNDIEQGHTERGIEAMLPAAIRNAMKSIRFGIEGATTKEGVKLTDDPNGYELVMQFFGFTPKDLGDRYAANEIMKSAQRNGTERRTALLARLNLAKQENDLDEILEIRRQIHNFNTKGPGASIVKPIKSETISKSEKQYQVKQRQMAQTYGVYLGKPMSREVRNLQALVPEEE